MASGGRRRDALEHAATLDGSRQSAGEAAASEAAASEDGGTSRPVRRLGRYLLLEKVGEGGMGTVYKAYGVAGAAI